jgi:hypothetical protein
MAQRYFALGQVGQYTRYAILSGDHTVIGTQISRPDGVEVDRPAVLRWRNATAPEVTVKTWRINEQPASHNGEQPRRPTWRRAGRTANPNA